MMAENASEDDLLKFKAEGRKFAAEIGDKRGSLLCGQVTGLIDDVPTVKELVDRIITEAEETIQKLPLFIKS